MLVGLAVATTGVTRALARLAGPDPLIVEVAGYQFWWDIVYPADGEAPWVRTANEVHLPAGRPVTFRLTTDDVIHSFWIPALGGKLDMIPGRVNELTVIAEEPGVYRGQCAEFCGRQHARMSFDVIVHAPEDFSSWRAARAEEADDPETLIEQRGQEVFSQNGCAACHAVRGVSEGARLGPDLTNVGARATIGAGMWATNVGNLAGWIANAQTLKPGVNMPSYTTLSGPDLRALATYLESLE